ncbi:hypothetical protein BC834DRAFT_843821 [Gloeopeniophorella convolvens]|nr:hypothetical protein BC834DRAFT_843821 [Gloeopeniophorella convolvens]
MPAIEPSSAAEHYHSLFLEALENYKKKTGRDPVAHTLVAQLNTSPGEVTRLLQEEAERLDAAHKSRWRTCMCEKIAPIVNIIRPLCDTAGKATGLAFKPGEAIFGSIGILLTIPGNYMKNHETFMGLLEQMVHFLRRLGTLIVPEDVLFDDGMMKIIVDILVELIRVFALLTDRMSLSDAFIHREVESMLKRLDELTKVEHLMAMAEARRDIAIVRREKQRQERMQQAERYRSWLSVPNSSTNQRIASEARHSDTSMWLVRGEVYEAWKSSGALLWVTGKSGAGKTVICSTVIKDLQDSLRSSGYSGAVAYFYCDFRDTQKQSDRGLLGSLLMDLSTQSDESDQLLRDLFSKCGGGSREPDANDLIRCLKEMLARSDGIKYIVVDALDEMPNHGVYSSRARSLELIRPTLKSLPITLHATYEATLEWISEEKWDHAHRLFQFLSFSARPLRVEELAEVLAVISEYDEWSDETQRVVQFTHFSVKEFLTSNQLSHSKATVSRFRVLPGPSNVVLAKTCLGILFRPDNVPAIEQSTPTDSERHQLQYAADFWDEHARFEDVSMSLLKPMKHLFDPTKPHFASWARIREPRQRQPGTLLYFAALCGLLPIVEHILASGSPDINARGGQRNTALHAALKECSPTVIRLLLDRGADVNARSSYYYGSALQAAASKGKLDIVQLLLDRGADVNAQDGHYGNVLQAAACNREDKIDIVQFFLDRGLDINAQGGMHGTALIGASYNGNLDIVRLLLARGADASIKSEEHGTALEAVPTSDSYWIPGRDKWKPAAIVELLSNVTPQDASVVPPTGGAGSSI